MAPDEEAATGKYWKHLCCWWKGHRNALAPDPPASEVEKLALNVQLVIARSWMTVHCVPVVSATRLAFGHFDSSQLLPKPSCSRRFTCLFWCCVTSVCSVSSLLHRTGLEIIDEDPNTSLVCHDINCTEHIGVVHILRKQSKLCVEEDDVLVLFALKCGSNINPNHVRFSWREADLDAFVLDCLEFLEYQIFVSFVIFHCNCCASLGRLSPASSDRQMCR